MKPEDTITARSPTAVDEPSGKTPVPPIEPSRPVRSWRTNRLLKRPGLLLSPLVLPLLALVVTALHELTDVNEFILPPAGDVYRAVVTDLGSPDVYQHIRVTTVEVVAGFLIGSFSGFVLGSVLARFRFLEDFVYPYIVALQTMPKVAVAPLLVIWLGFGVGSKILVAALLCFFPVLVNVIVGLRSADKDYLDLMDSLSASSWQTWHLVRLPGALKVVFAGLEVAIVLAMVGAIVGEFVGASEGLGYLIQQRNARLDSAGIYSVLMILAIQGCALTAIVRFITRKAVRWDDA